MFGNLFELAGKIQKAKQEVAAARTRLAEIIIEKSSDDGKIRVRISADKTIREIHIDTTLMQFDADYLARKLRQTLNQALDEATQIQENEVKKALQRVLPDIPGLDKLF